MSRAYTPEEIRKEFVGHVRHLIDYWQNETRAPTSREKLEGFAHSVLCILDGVTGLPAFDIVVQPHPDDKQFQIDEGENWYEPGTVINDCHLHDMLYAEQAGKEGE